MTIEERLNEILIEKEDQISKLKRQVEGLTDAANLERVSWQRHQAFQNDEFYQKLPYPRIEMRLQRVSLDDWYAIEWVYGLVYKHLTDTDSDTLLFVPLSKTTASGGNCTFGNWCKGGQLDLPFRDGLHVKLDARVLNLPAYIVCREMEVVNAIDTSGAFDRHLSKMINPIQSPTP